MKVIIGLMFLVLGSVPVAADELQVVLNGKAIHLKNGHYNESNTGLGLEYDFRPQKNWITFIHGSVFKDSNDQTSKYIGGGSKRRFLLENDPNGWRFDAGWIAFLMTREDYRNNQPFFGALPFVSIGKQWFTLNATYIPSISPKHVDLFFFQAMVRIAEF